MKLISLLGVVYQKFVDYSQERILVRWWRKYSIQQFKDARCNIEQWKPLSKRQKKEIAEYWGMKHPGKSDFLTHEIMLNIKGDFDVRYCPECVFRLYLDDPMPLNLWTDKNYYDCLQPDLPLPYTYVRNVNGCFLDHDYRPISKEDAKKTIAGHLPLIIKPTVLSGEGKNIRLISTEKDAEDIFTQYEKDYLLQELIVQCDELKNISPNSVASMRIITAMINGEPKVLKKHILGNTTDSIAVNTHPEPGEGVVIIKIDDNGMLDTVGYFENAKKLAAMPSGFSFGGLRIPAYQAAEKLALEAHKRMPRLDFVAWDVTIDEHNRPVFIEWNQRGLEIYHSQLSQGPLFGEYSDYFAEIAKQRKKERR